MKGQIEASEDAKTKHFKTSRLKRDSETADDILVFHMVASLLNEELR